MLIKMVNGGGIAGTYKWKLDEFSDVMGSFVVFDKNTHVELWAFGIYGEYRGMGYGQQMLKEVICMVDNRELKLYVYRDNARAIHVYEKAGFRITGSFMGEQAWTMTYIGNQTESLATTKCCA